MALFISSLNSGSNGNCYYVGNNTEAVLIDAGISCRMIEKRMKNLGLNIHLVKGLFISHEHSDHIKGVETLIKKYNIPLYISRQTYLNSGLEINEDNLYHFNHSETIAVSGLKLHAFSKIHDAHDPYSFHVEDDEVRVGIFTDIGFCCDNVVNSFRGCHAAFLESNYDEEMLINGAYPYFLKQRISGGRGHLSNREAFHLFTEHRHEGMTHLILAHLSHNNNNPEIVERLFKSNCGHVKIHVASRHEASPVFEISLKQEIKIVRQVYIQAAFNF